MLTIDLVLTNSPTAAAVSGADREREGFARAIRLLEPGVTTLVWRLLGWSAQSSEVEDVVQEVFLSAWMNRARLRDSKAFPAWVRTIAVRQTRNHVRARTRRRRVLALCGMGPREEPAHEPTESNAFVREGLAKLRHDDREVVVLRYLEGFGIGEIAELLGLRRSAVDGRLSRARKRLEVVLREEGLR